MSFEDSTNKQDRISENDAIGNTFSESIEYEGLPFIFSGGINVPTREAHLALHMQDFQKEVERVPNKFAAPGDLMRSGEIGSISLSPHSGGRGDTYMNRVRSHTMWLPDDSKYKNVHIGRFMMNNLLAIADANKWSMYAFPYTDGQLSDYEVLQWLERKGFDARGIREPQELDRTLPIVKYLK